MAYICICTPTTETQIKDQCSSVSSVIELIDKLQICQNCKTCKQEIELLYNNSKK